NPAYLRAVTRIPARSIGDDALRPARADDTLARRAVNADPVRGGLPARVRTGQDGRDRQDRSGAGERPDRPAIARPPIRSFPTAGLPDTTGAATRTPGAPLDDELRRSRIFNGREPRGASPADTSRGGTPESRPTGAVSRPPRIVGGGDSGNPDVTGPTGESSKPVRSRVTTPAAPTNPDGERP